jgi:hypothetical protein
MGKKPNVMTKNQFAKSQSKTQQAIIESHLEARQRAKDEAEARKNRVRPYLCKPEHPMVPVFERIFPYSQVGVFSVKVDGDKITAGWYAGGFGYIEAVTFKREGYKHISIYNTLPNGSYENMMRLAKELMDKGYTVNDYVGSSITDGYENHKWY